ncbi:MAG TPA: Zn-ribbon domain-containing OB-fold protein [bacterium]|nr:Zn-ribbon domain-containing OB-fold protein [bacterium]
MSDKPEKTVELIVVPELCSIPQTFSTGQTMGRFLTALRDEKKIMGNKCPQCGRTQIPPRIVCAECDVEVSEWVELGPGGYVTSFDVVYIPTINPLTGKMREVPYTTTSIVLDNGDATLMHFLDETDPKKIKVGSRVEPVFRPDGERSGSVLDILYFRVIPGQVQEVKHAISM